MTDRFAMSGRANGAKTALAAGRWRLSHFTRGDPLQSVIVLWLLFLAVDAVYAIVRPVIRAVLPDVGVLISLSDLLDVLLVFVTAVGAVAAVACIVAIAVRTVREEFPRTPSQPTMTRPGFGTTRSGADRDRQA